MSEYLEQASRVTDPVVHSDLDIPVALTVAGLLGGVPVAMAAPISLGAAAALVITAGAEARGAGEILANRQLKIDLANRNLPKSTGETIVDGANTVFLDEIKERAAKAHPNTKLSHGSHWVISGSSTVLIEKTYASRITDSTMCGGYVCYGSETIFYGGAKKIFPGAPAEPDEVLDMGLYGDVAFAMDVAELILLSMEGVGVARALARSAARRPRLADQLEVTDATEASPWEPAEALKGGVVPAELSDQAVSAYRAAPDGTAFYGLYDTSTGRVVMEPAAVANAHRANLGAGASGHQAVGNLHGMPSTWGHPYQGFSVMKLPEGPDVFYKSASYNESAGGILGYGKPHMYKGPAAFLEDAMIDLRPAGSTRPVGGPLSMDIFEREFSNRYYGN